MRRRILQLTLSTTFLVVLAFAVPLAVLIGRETAQRAGIDLVNQAQTTAFAIRSSESDADVETYLDDSDDAHGTSTRVTRDGRTLGTLPDDVAAALAADDQIGVPGTGGGTGGSAPTAVPTAAPTGVPTGVATDGGFDGSGGGSAGGGFGGGPGGGLREVPGGQVAVGFNRESAVLVVVFASDEQLRSGATGWFALLAGASVLLLGLAAAAAVVVSRRISAPLVATAEAAHRLSAGDLGARAPTRGPREVAEVGTALNRLAGRIDELIGEARETVADLSHRLRTPLTAMRLDADRLADPAEAELMAEHVSTLQRSLTAAISAARRPEREGAVPSCDAATVVRERVAFWEPLADDQGREVRCEVPDHAVDVRAAASDLAAAVDALVENVLAHTPEETGFRVTLSPAPGGGGVLEVADGGPGIPPGAHVRGRSDRGSSGLGLSIAARCAEGSGGSLEICADPPGGGGLVRLVLGAP